MNYYMILWIWLIIINNINILFLKIIIWLLLFIKILWGTQLINILILVLIKTTNVLLLIIIIIIVIKIWNIWWLLKVLLVII